MPTTSEIAIFQREYPAAALWCMDSINSPEPLGGQDFLSVENRNWVLQRIADDRLTGPSEPARMYECPQIPNGDYAVTYDGVNHQFRVWTVQQGQLAGARIVKHQHNGIFRGFAFITRDGNLRIWSRFASQATSPHALAFERVMMSLTNETYENVFYQIRRRCPICNNYVTEEETEDESVRVELCGNHAHMRDSNPGDGLLSEPRRSVTDTRSLLRGDTEEIQRAIDEGGYAAPTRPTRTRTPRILMCENGTGLVR